MTLYLSLFKAVTQFYLPTCHSGYSLSRVFHKLDEIGNNYYVKRKKRIQLQKLPQVGIEPRPLINL